MKSSKFSRTAMTLAALCGSLGITSCGSDEKPAGTTPGVVVDGAWARTSAAGAEMGAAYMTVISQTDDSLIDVKVDPQVAETAQIHEVVTSGDEMGTGSTDMSTGSSAAPEMTMQEVEDIELPSGVEVELKPGGYHIMLMHLARPLEAGGTVSLTLVFTKAGELTVSVPVQDDAS